MPIKTYTEQLESVQAAIESIESGNQSYRLETGIGTGRTVTRGDLQTLYSQEKRLRGLVAREARGGGARVRYGTPQ